MLKQSPLKGCQDGGIDVISGQGHDRHVNICSGYRHHLFGFYLKTGGDGVGMRQQYNFRRKLVLWALVE